MRPPYQISPSILSLVAAVSEKIGQINARFLDKPSPQLRKENRIKTIHSSLHIEGNTLTQEQITALIEKKRIIGPEKDVKEVLNAIQVYQQLDVFVPHSMASFQRAHEILMKDLVADNGKFRSSSVGILAGNDVAHLAPPAHRVRQLMKDLFHYLKHSEEITLVKSCVFHYEMEFIHPFSDGNGRMGRLWQTLILMKEYPVFEFIPFENVIHKTQSDYYLALSASDKAGNSTPFIEYMLKVIDDSLNNLLHFKGRILNTENRLAYFHEKTNFEFSRLDYMRTFKEISTATASRDLKKGVALGLFEKHGEKSKTLYRKISLPQNP